MSKKEKYSKHLEKGRFYLVHDGSKTGHPGKIYEKNDKKNRYYAIKTGTTYDKHKIPLNFPTDSSTNRSYVDKRPFVGKRRDFGDKELGGMNFHKSDKGIIKVIQRRNPVYSQSFKRRKKKKK
ncbi:MAG: hypothetical protein J1F31_00925 [Erysipelotrichales bacterium]|nr:hypothetical protein [Erysipelotrichales bacterium]